MSTSISPAYRLGYDTLEDLWQACQALLPNLKAAAEDIECRLIAARACHLLDVRILEGDTETCRALSQARREIAARRDQIARTGTRDPEVDLGFEAVLFLDPESRETYALLYTEQKDFIAAWEKVITSTDASWWNSSDRPPDVSETTWTRRARTWQRLIGHDAPADRGLIFKPRLMPLLDPPSIAAAQPDKARRVREHAIGQVIQEQLTSLPPTPAMVISQVYALRAWVRDTSEGQEALAAATRKISDRIPDHYTIEDLRGFE